METTKQNIFKGIILFMLFSFVGYLLIVLMGFVMGSMGLGCNCYNYSAMGVGAAALIGFAVCWYNSCRNSECEIQGC